MNTKAHVTVTEHYVRKIKRLFHGKIWSWLGLILHWFLPLESCLNAYTFAQILHSGVFSSKSWVKNSILLTSLSSASCQVVVVHSIVLPRFCTLWNSWPNVCECFTGPRVIPRVSAVFRGLRVSEGLQRVGGGMGIGVPRSVPASSVPAFRGLTRTRRSTDMNTS